MKIRRFQPYYFVDFVGKSGRALSFKTHSKRKVLNYTRRFFKNNGEFKCRYGSGVINSAPFKSLNSFEGLMDSWTDNQMIKHIIGEW